MRPIVKDSTDQSVVIRIVDSADGTPEQSVEHNSGGISLWYRREGGSVTAITPAALAAANSAHADGGIEHLDDGYYRLDLPDAAVATGANGVMVGGTLTDMVVIGCYVPLVNVNPYDAVRGGMTALPNAAADAAGGLPISDAGGLDMDAMRSDVAAILVDTGTTLDGKIDTIDNFLDTEVAAILAAVDTEVAAILADTNELQADWANGGRLDLILDARASQSSVDTIDGIVDAILVDTAEIGAAGAGLTNINLPNQTMDIVGNITGNLSGSVGSVTGNVGGNVVGSVGSVTGHTPQTGDSYARLGAPAGASIAADIAAIEAQTDDIGALGAGLTAIIGADGDTLKTISDQIDGLTTSAGPQVLVDTTIASLSSQTSFTLTAGSADNDAYNGAVAIITDQSTATQKAVATILDYVGSTKTITLAADPGIFTMATGDSIAILANISSAPSAATIRAEMDANSTKLASIEGDTNELQGDWANGGRLDLILDARASQASVDTIDDFLDTEVAAIKAKTDNLPTDPADASDIAAAFSSLNTKVDTIDDFLDTEIAAIKAKTDNLPSDPADASDISSSFSTVNSTLSTIASYLDTEIAAIKEKTDNLPSDPADQSSVEAAITSATSGLATAAALAVVDDFLDTEVAAIKAKTDLIPAAPAAVGDIPTAVQNADALLGRNVAGGSSTGRLVKEALYFLRNKWTVAGGTLTVYATDDTTSAWTASVSTDDAAEPVVGSDPT